MPAAGDISTSPSAPDYYLDHSGPRAGLMTGDPALLPWSALQQWLRNQPDEQCHGLDDWLQSQPAALQHEQSWEVCLHVWITAQGQALQTLLQQPPAEGSSENTLYAGLALMRWLDHQRSQLQQDGNLQSLADALARQLELVTGALHHGLVIQGWQGERRPEWLWCGWELLSFRETMSASLPNWWAPVREQLVRFGALAWSDLAKLQPESGRLFELTITRSLTLLQVLATMHDPLPEWIPLQQRELAYQGLTVLLAAPDLEEQQLRLSLRWLQTLVMLDGVESQDGSTMEQLQGLLREALTRAGWPELARRRSKSSLVGKCVLDGSGLQQAQPIEPSGPPVTLTAISRRLATLPAVLDSLRQQTRRPDRIHLHLSHDGYLLDEGVPLNDPVVLQLTNDPWIQIHWVPNLGPYRKIVPFLEAAGYSSTERTEDLFITIDDDTIYPPRFVEYVTLNRQRHDCVVAHRGRRIRCADQGGFLPYSQWHDGLREPRLANLATGQSGVLYRRSDFPADLQLEAALALAPTHDDLWLRWLTAANGVPAVILQPNAAAKTQELAFPSASALQADQGASLWFAYNSAEGSSEGNNLATALIASYFQARGFDLEASLLAEREACADFY